MENIIDIRNLTKNYGNNKGIFDLSFTVKKGECFGFLGPNGAGKTTTIRQLMGFTNSDNGECLISGKNCRNEYQLIQKDIGYIAGEIVFPDEMCNTGDEFIKFMADYKSLKDLTYANKLVEIFELDTKTKIKKMSKGMKQKLAIIVAFMSQPKILILDEPTSGLDPLMQNKFIELIQQQKKNDCTILMSSHIFEEVEKTCSRVGIIKNGRLVTVDSIENIKKNAINKYKIIFNNISDIQKLQDKNITIENIQNNMVIVSIKNNINELIEILSKCDIQAFKSIEFTLEDAFMDYYK